MYEYVNLQSRTNLFNQIKSTLVNKLIKNFDNKNVSKNKSKKLDILNF